MDKVFNHAREEKQIYFLWEHSCAFIPKKDNKKKPFTIIMPPPNANDNLHIGHARFLVIEDILIRYHRMKGDPTLWLPGSDHAGIETQFVFEKRLQEQEKSRFDYDHDTLYKMLWDYTNKYKKNMEAQIRAIGASCDWSKNTFTLDPKIVKIVYKIFKKLYDDGLVYRGERIVNYCPSCGTAFSQLEVNYVERDDPMYYLDYKTLTIATTRPETIFADVAVAVNPKDSSKKKLVGKTATIPIVNREIPIIEDPLVDQNFGTGALKVTPGHDPTDFEIGQKHKLHIISVIDKEGKLINTPQKYIGLKVEEARKLIVSDLEKEGKIKKTEMVRHLVGTCYRCKRVIEPTLSKQWFIKVKPLSKRALTSIQKGEVKFVSSRYEKIAKHWLKNLKDWNISRQIVWGIRIPAWRCQKCLEWTITEGETPKECKMCGNKILVQDSDTFDTWFSSGMWPFATLKAISNDDFEYFYPTSLMETAYDIIPFWVVRMIMLGLYETGKVPFKEVLIHGLVRDKEGQKISKSKGNVINPLLMIEKYGADALRMGIVWGALVENDISLSEDNIRGQRNFANKIWNISRYITQNKTKIQTRRPTSKHKDDKWILKELRLSTKKITKALESYRLNEAAETLYSFVWKTFADKYLERSKSRKAKAQKVLEYVLQETLKLSHPFMPFVSETIWQLIFSKGKNDLLINEAWPKK